MSYPLVFECALNGFYHFIANVLFSRLWPVLLLQQIPWTVAILLGTFTKARLD